MNHLLAKLSEQQVLLETQKKNCGDTSSATLDTDDSYTGSSPQTPDTDSINESPVSEACEEEKTIRMSQTDMAQLQKELDAAKNKIAQQEQELTKSRKQSAPAASKAEAMDRTITNLQSAFNASARVFGAYGNREDTTSDSSADLPAGDFGRNANIWNNMNGTTVGAAPMAAPTPANIWDNAANRPFLTRSMAPPMAPLMIPQQMQNRAFSGPSSPSSSGNGRFSIDFNQFHGAHAMRRTNTQSNRQSTFSGPMFPPRGGAWDGLTSGETSPLMSVTSPAFSQMSMYSTPMGYQPRPIGTPLSPTAAEFTSGNTAGPWNSTVSTDSFLSHLSPNLLT